MIRGYSDPSFQQAFDLAFSQSGEELYVTQAMGPYVAVLDTSGTVVRTFGAGFLTQPRGIAVLNGEVYVADTGGGDVDVFDADGNHLRSIGPVPAPLNLAFSADGRLLFVSESNYYVGVQVFDLADGDRYLGVFGETTTQVKLTAGLAVAPDGTLYVGDAGHFGTDSVIRRSPLRAYTPERWLPGGLTSPADLTLSRDGDVWLTNTNNFGGDKIRAYASNGQLLTSFGAEWASRLV